jgi:hypothetical protein
MLSLLDGGLILNIDGQDVLFPQCCADLGDIDSWINILEGENVAYFYQGHPAPIVSIENDIVKFDLTNEPFNQPTQGVILVKKHQLDLAIRNAVEELELFSRQLIKLNKDHNLNINDIEKVFIYGG